MYLQPVQQPVQQANNANFSGVRQKLRTCVFAPGLLLAGGIAGVNASSQGHYAQAVAWVLAGGITGFVVASTGKNS